MGPGETVGGVGVSNAGSRLGVGSGDGELDDDWWYCCKYCRDVEAWVVSGDGKFQSFVSESHFDGIGSSLEDVGGCVSVCVVVGGSTASEGW